MTDEHFKHFVERMEEVWATKESVASNVLMSLKDELKAISKNVNNLQGEIRSMDYKIDGAIKSLQAENDRKHIMIDNSIERNGAKVSFLEKMVFGTAGTILLAVIGALVASILK